MPASYADVASLAVGLVLPALVALGTRPSTNTTIKGLAHAVLSVGAGFAAVHQAHPTDFSWPPAVVDAFLAWMSGTAFYHSLLKKYSWFAALQNLFVRGTEEVLNTKDHQIADYLELALAAQTSANDFPLSTDAPEKTEEPAAPPVVEQPAPAVAVAPEAATQALIQQPDVLGPRAV